MPLRLALTVLLVVALTSAASLHGALGSDVKRPRPSDDRLHLVASKRGAILSGRNLSPGDRVAGSVTIRNAGALSGSFTLRAGLRGSRQLAQHLVVAVRERTPRKTRLVYSGSLARFRTVRLGKIGPHQARTFRFAVRLRSNVPNGLQGRRATASFTWRAVQPS